MLTKILNKKIVEITTNAVTETEVVAVEVEIKFGSKSSKGLLYFEENQAGATETQLDYLLLPIKSNGWYFNELVNMYVNPYRVRPLSESIDEIIYLQKEISEFLDGIDAVAIENFTFNSYVFTFDIFDPNSDDQETLAVGLESLIMKHNNKEAYFSETSLGMMHSVSEKMKISYESLVYTISRAVIEEYENYYEVNKEKC